MHVDRCFLNPPQTNKPLNMLHTVHMQEDASDTLFGWETTEFVKDTYLMKVMREM